MSTMDSPLLPMQMSHARQRLCPIEPEDKGEVLVQSLLRQAFPLCLTEGHALPVLPFVPAEIEHIKWAGILRSRAIASLRYGGRVTSDVTSNPAAAELLGDGEGCAGAAEEVRDEVTCV